MKIAYFTDTYLPQINGVTNTLDILGSYLCNNNIDHMFFAPYYSKSSKGLNHSLVKRFKSISFPLYSECRLSLPSYSNLCKVADDFKPDLIHLVTPLGIGLMGLRYAKERNIPIVSSFHTNFDIYLKYYKLEYLEDLVWSFFKWFHDNSIVNFCPSNDTLETLRRKGIENLKIWSRGVDTDKFSPDHKNENLRRKLGATDKILFLYVGRLAAEKDLDVLTQSINNINELHPGKAQFIFVGDGPYAKNLKKLPYNNLLLTGYKRGKDLSEIYASCDVFVFPSSTETFGNVVLEAMSSGLPVAASNSGGIKESLIHNYNGISCIPKNVYSFTKAIETYITDRSLISKMSENARSFALTKSWKSVLDRLIIDYKLALEHGKLIKTA